MPGPPSPLIENYLREAGFWNMATIGWGCKLNPKLISTLIERWRLETHTFHLLCKECTITLEDVHLQLELLVDGYAVTRSAQSTDWGAVCYKLLGAILDNINGGQIKMSWLLDTFPELDNDLTELERIRYIRAYILEIIGGYLMPDLSQNLVRLRWLLKLVDFRAVGEFSWGFVMLATLYREMWNRSASYVGLPTSLEDIRLLLDQWSKAQVPLVNYAIMEMHQSDRVLRKFGFRQLIPVAPEVLNDEHKIDLR
ncbi:hypothetical protein PVK06_009077 [Gossypium arboreum]|uniref:Aminotransferase-like plant mobile domain-containing protein n=1 Tax=Gossypium arboreum TaxID=29729 RepID=A0ABR0QLI7_GOSAR|nr:hypothetical protein PVK06_009077 [Gossypium arboreum]